MYYIDKSYLEKQFKNFAGEMQRGFKSGDPGKSAYEVAKDNGFVGTEAAWLQSLKGDSGDSPEIGDNNNWFVGDEDTGVSATPDVTIENDHWILNGKDSGVPIPAYTDLLRYLDQTKGIQDTPVGHVIAHMGTSAPQHYLACDGAVYNISDYPELANHFAAAFGNSGYFGGDGETTFAVPNLQGEFLRGTGANSHVNQGSGADVGAHMDGTLHPGVLYNGGDKRVQINISKSINNTFQAKNIDYYKTRVAWASATGTYGSSTSNTAAEYTSRPTNTSVLWCIKSEPTYYMDFSGATITINGESVNSINAISQEAVQNAVGEYFMQNPSPITVETVEKVESNASEISSLKDSNSDIEDKIEQLQADTDYVIMMSGI